MAAASSRHLLLYVTPSLPHTCTSSFVHIGNDEHALTAASSAHGPSFTTTKFRLLAHAI